MFAFRSSIALGFIAFMNACATGTGATTTSGAGGNGNDSSSSSASSSSSSASSSSTSSASSSSGAGGGPTIQTNTLLTLNLHCLRLDGTVYTTNADRFAAIAALVAEREVSAIALQEVCQRPGENAINALLIAIENATKTNWASAWAFAHIAWEGTSDQADEGVGLLVRGSFSNPTQLQHVVQGSLHRVALGATLPAEWSNVRLTSVHFEVFEESARTMQAREIAVAALVETDPNLHAIVAGDFNDVEGSATHAAFPAMGYLAANAGLDPAGIDHVMIHRATPFRPIKREKVFLGAQAVSDHPGILVTFEATQGDNVTITRVRTDALPGENHYLSIRGSLSPLTWDLGFPLHQKTVGSRVFLTTEMQSNFEFKLLHDDQTWQTGPNNQGNSGSDHWVMPTF